MSLSTRIDIQHTDSLFGIALGQTIYYYRAYPNDRRYIKIFVGILSKPD